MFISADQLLYIDTSGQSEFTPCQEVNVFFSQAMLRNDVSVKEPLMFKQECFYKYSQTANVWSVNALNAF